jgi:hypothetical protein
MWLLHRVPLQRGHRSSVAPRSISLVLPGSDYKANDLEQFQRQAAAEGDMSLMEIAWAVASEDPRPHTLPELSTLLFDNDTAANLYVTYVMLQRDAVYFKQVRPGQGLLSQAGQWVPVGTVACGTCLHKNSSQRFVSHNTSHEAAARGGRVLPQA